MGPVCTRASFTPHCKRLSINLVVVPSGLIQAALSKLKSWIRTADEIGWPKDPPRTCSGWMMQANAVRHGLSKHAVVGEGYLRSWGARSFLLASMSAKVPRWTSGSEMLTSDQFCLSLAQASRRRLHASVRPTWTR
jgi:hypothetical protein